MVGDDGGVGITIDGGKSFTRIALPNAQMYHVATDILLMVFQSTINES